jgi:hypothetical protein
MNTILQKLRYKEDQNALLLNAPERFNMEVADANLMLDVTDRQEHFDFVLLFVHNRADVERLGPLAARSGRYDAVLWMAYPKGGEKAGTDINRDNGWDTLTALGLQPVAQVAIDDTWSAVRFRPADQVN